MAVHLFDMGKRGPGGEFHLKPQEPANNALWQDLSLATCIGIQRRLLLKHAGIVILPLLRAIMHHQLFMWRPDIVWVTHFVMDCFKLSGQRLMLVMMISWTLTHHHKPWRLGRCYCSH